jgi:hypothetical protein
MTHKLFRVVFSFILGGLQAVLGKLPKDTTSTMTEEEFEVFLSALTKKTKSVGSRSVITPFEVLMEKHFTPEVVESKSVFIECVLSALTDICEEIRQVSPDSELTNTVKRDDINGKEVIKGYIEWKLDKNSPLVYPICMDLMKDGFMFMAKEKAFVITVRIS